MADNAHEQAVLAAAKAWWEAYQVPWPRYRFPKHVAAARVKLFRAVADWQQAEQARKDGQ